MKTEKWSDKLEKPRDKPENRPVYYFHLKIEFKKNRPKTI
jgi:hypothetical protein